MTHQELRQYNANFDWEDVPDDSEVDSNGEPEWIPVDLSTWKVLKEWEFNHYGNTSEDIHNWHEDGKIVIYDSEVEDTYLEASIKGVPFFSLLSTLDQWGTWHTFRVGGDSVRQKDDLVTFAQEWGNPSFLESLGEALIFMAHQTEPDPKVYSLSVEEADAQGLSYWRRQE